MSQQQRYLKHDKFGEGTYSRIFSGKDTLVDEPVIIKLVGMDEGEEGIPSGDLREISILKHLDHPNIIKLMDVLTVQGPIWMILEVAWCNLDHYRRRYGGIRPDLQYSYAYQLLAGVCYLGHNNIIHKDIRPEHLLLSRTGLLKICDFQNAIRLYKPMHLGVSDYRMIYYQAPELLFEGEADTKADVWSCGCIIAEMTRGSPLFTGDSQLDQLMKICGILGTPIGWDEFDEVVVSSNIPLPTETPEFSQFFPPETDPLLLDLLKKLLQVNPAKRITALEALQHEYFKSANSNIVATCLKPIVTNK